MQKPLALAQRGEYAKAATWFDAQKPNSADKLLFLLEQATLLSAAGEYQRSNSIFDQAQRMVDGQTAHVPTQVSSMLANDNVIPYMAGDAEKLLIDLFQALNYLAMDDVNSALVEIRQINTKYADYFGAKAPLHQRIPFAKFVAAHAWDAAGKFNDAYIDYRWLADGGMRSPWLGALLLRDCRRLGRNDQCQRWKEIFSQEEPFSLPEQHGQLIIFIGQGWAPQKISATGRSGPQAFPIPAYPKNIPPPRIATIAVNGEPQSAELFTDMAPVLRAMLSADMGAIVARATARLATKTGAAVAVAEGTKNDDLGILVGALLFASNEADLRSWLTLPRSWQALQLILPAGQHHISIPGLQIDKHVTVDLPSGKTTFVFLRTP